MRHHRHPDDDSLAGKFRYASRLMARAHHRDDHAHHAQHRVLSIIMERDTIPQGELLEILDVRSSSLSEILRKLERRELITRQRSEKDKRSFEVSVTPKAKTMFADREENESEGDQLFDCLDETEQEQLKNILEKLIGSHGDEDSHRCRGCRDEGQGRGKGRRGRGRGRGGSR